MNKRYRPLMIAAMNSGAGKTSITFSIIRAMLNMGISICAYKTGPDYIDTMYHKIASKKECINLDPFFLDEEDLKMVFDLYRSKNDICIIEGAMGFYSGIYGMEPRASAYSVAKAIGAAAILIVGENDIEAIEEYIYRYDENIVRGIIFNKIDEHRYKELKGILEAKKIKVYGYIPYREEFIIPSRHLGLSLPFEREDMDAAMNNLSDIVLETLDIESVLKDLEYNDVEYDIESMKYPKSDMSLGYPRSIIKHNKSEYRLAISYDKAFCFLYHDNIRLLEESGARIIFFSPLYDKRLPKDIDGLWLIGGYPEIYAKALSDNISMKLDIKKAIERKTPTVAECGGFIYLHKAVEGKDTNFYELCNVFDKKVVNTNKLSRFGYIEILAKEDNLLLSKGEMMRSHEFHYWDSEFPGSSHLATKANKSKEWECIISDKNIFAGFPHIYLRSNLNMLENFSKSCIDFKERKLKKKN